jgi:hypothetical protein
VPAEFEGPLFLEPRRSFPYAGTIRIRFKGFPRCPGQTAPEARRCLSPLAGLPLESTEVSRGATGTVKGRVPCWWAANTAC